MTLVLRLFLELRGFFCQHKYRPIDVAIRNPIFITVIATLLLLLATGWLGKRWLLEQYYFNRFEKTEVKESRCQSLRKLLELSKKADLEAVVRQLCPEERCNAKRTGLLSDGYAVAEILDERTSVLQVVLLKKGPTGDFQIVFSCEKFLG